jgi:phage shock protein A
VGALAATASRSLSGEAEAAPAATSSTSASASASAGQLEGLGAKALAAKLLAAQQETRDLRKELERTIVSHAEEDEAVRVQQEALAAQVEELGAALEEAEARIQELTIAAVGTGGRRGRDGKWEGQGERGGWAH